MLSPTLNYPHLVHLGLQVSFILVALIFAYWKLINLELSFGSIFLITFYYHLAGLGVSLTLNYSSYASETARHCAIHRMVLFFQYCPLPFNIHITVSSIEMTTVDNSVFEIPWVKCRFPPCRCIIISSSYGLSDSMFWYILDLDWILKYP